MRAQLGLGNMNQVINPMMDTNKLRSITSKFKRHSIRRFLRPPSNDPNQLLYGHGAQQAKLRQSVADYFFVYTRQVLPKMEEKIELQLLEKFKDRINNPQEKKEVIQAYYNRKDNLAKMEEPEEAGQAEKREEMMTLKGEEIHRVIMSVEGDGLSYHTYEDIGRYTVFPDTHWKRMFPSKCFGNYERDELDFNNTFGIMTREEGLRLTNDLARLTLPHERNVDYQKFITFENSDVKEEIIKDEQKFIAIQQDFSGNLLDYINSQPNDYHQELKKLFQSPAVFDGLVAILVQELRKKPIRYHLCIPEARMKVIDQMVRAFHKVMIDHKLNPQKLGEIIENLPLIQIDLAKKDLGAQHELQKNEVHNYKMYMSGYHKICYHHWRPEDIRRVSLPRFKGVNSGCLLWGRRGVGKSQILSYATAWAHENQWMVVTIPRCEMFTDGTEEIFRYKNGLYLQNHIAKNLLYDFRVQNELLLRNTDVDMSIYGKYDISGVKDGDPEPHPRVWDARRQCWSDSWKDNLYDFEIKQLQQQYEQMQYRCSDKLPDPKKLIDIVDLGILDPEIATNCFAEILEQLYHSNKFHVLFAMDGYNDWFKPSQYLSFRYENSRYLRGHVPPQDFALVRLLMRFDGHMVRNGFKLFSTTHQRQFNHLCTPDMINMPDGYHAQVDNLALNDFRNMLIYKNITDWMPDFQKEWEVESYYMETQGNWHAFHDSFNGYQRVHY